MLLGVVFFRERLRPRQTLSIVLAAVGKVKARGRRAGRMPLASRPRRWAAVAIWRGSQGRRDLAAVQQCRRYTAPSSQQWLMSHCPEPACATAALAMLAAAEHNKGKDRVPPSMHCRSLEN